MCIRDSLYVLHVTIRLDVSCFVRAPSRQNFHFPVLVSSQLFMIAKVVYRIVGGADEFYIGTAEDVYKRQELLSAARTTGDGYYESCVADPDGNRIELTV